MFRKSVAVFPNHFTCSARTVGNDIETPVQTRDAVLSCGGVPAVNNVFCECVEVSCERSAKLEGISQVRNVQFEESA